MRALALVAAVVLVGGLAAFFLLREPTSADLAPAARSAAADGARPGTDAALVADDASAAPRAVPADATHAERSAIAAAPSDAAAASEPTEELLLVDAVTRAAIAGATAHWADIPAEDYRAWFDWNAGLGPGCRRVETQGRALRSDAKGVVRVPVPQGHGVVVARSGDRFGIWWYDSEAPRPWTLALERDADWLVHARDVAGRPIPGLLIQLNALAAPPRGSGLVVQLATDEHGDARIEHALHVLADVEAQRFSIEPVALLGEPVRVECSGKTPPAQPTELVLPAVGTARVRVLDPSGAELPRGDHRYDQQNVWLRDANDPPELKPGPRVARVPVDDAGRYRIHVQTGFELEAIHRVSSVGGASSARGSGPRSAFEEVAIDVRVTTPLVRMRVLDAQGPCVRRALEVARRVTSASGGGSSGGQVHRTDGDGVLVLPVEALRAGTFTLLTLTDEQDDSRQALVHLRQPSDGGWVDVGDVLLTAAPLLVAGRVCDASGAPITGAQVDVRGALSAEYSPAAASAAAPDPALAEYQRRVRLMLGPGWQVTSDADGRFEVHAFPICAELELCAQRAGEPRGEPVAAVVGATDVRLVLTSGGTLEGRVLLPDSMLPEHVRLTVEPPRDPSWSDSRDRAQPQLAADATWRASGLRAGRWTLKVQDARVFAWEPLVPPVVVDVVAGTTTRAPDIDLRGGLRTLSISVVDEHGAPIAEGQGTFHGAGSGEDNDIDVRDGKAMIHTRHASIEAWIGAVGRRCVHVPELADGARIVLLPAPTVELRLRDLAALPPEEFELRVQLDPGGDGWVLGEISRSTPGSFDRAGVTHVTVLRGGTLRVKASVRRAGGLENAQTVWVQKVPPAQQVAAEVTLDLDAALPEAIELDVDPAAVRAAVEKLRAQ